MQVYRMFSTLYASILWLVIPLGTHLIPPRSCTLHQPHLWFGCFQQPSMSTQLASTRCPESLRMFFVSPSRSRRISSRHLLICRSLRRVLPMACVPRDPYPGLLRLFRSSSAYASLPLIFSLHPLSCFLNRCLHSHAHSLSPCAPPFGFRL